MLTRLAKKRKWVNIFTKCIQILILIFRGAYLYRKDRKKPRKKTNEGAATQSSEDGSSGSPARMDTDEGQVSSSSEDESSTDGEYIPVELTPNLKELLKNDYQKINTHKMVSIHKNFAIFKNCNKFVISFNIPAS